MFVTAIDLWEHLCSLAVFVKPFNASTIVERFISRHTLLAPLRAVCRPLLGLLRRAGCVAKEGSCFARSLDRFDHRIDYPWKRVAPGYRIAWSGTAPTWIGATLTI